MRILTPTDIARQERRVIASGVSAAALMEEAGKQAFLYLQRNVRDLATLRIWICCGPGNNGGDGLVLARYLLDFGAQVHVYLFSDDGKIKTAEARKNLETLFTSRPSVQWITGPTGFDQLQAADFRPDWIVDAVLGIGCKGDLTGVFLQYVRWINDQKSPRTKILALDIPTGLDARTGVSRPESVSADITLSFEYLKYGFYLADGLKVSGRIICLPIGIGWDAGQTEEPVFRAIASDSVPHFPIINPDFHKTQRGHAMIVAGSREKSGAAILSTLACLRAGVGLCTIATPESSHTIIKSQLINAMSEVLPENADGSLASSSVDFLISQLERKTALLVGPGLAPDSQRKQWLSSLLSSVPVPMILDAQVLTDLGQGIRDLDFSKCLSVITPHPGEMSRLTGRSIDDILKNRFDVALGFAKDTGLVVVLKGRNTLVALPTGELWVNQIDHPCLSVGGTGDVLAGILVSLLAQGMVIEEAAQLAVFIHGRCGQRLGERLGIRGVLASDLLIELPSVIHEIHSNSTA